MTIDEAIQRENKIAEENQKIVDTEIVFDGVSLSQLYCDDTEVIEEHLENYKKCAEYHKQIAEWLEELKALRILLDWAIECGFGLDSFLDEYEQYKHTLTDDMNYTEMVKKIAKCVVEEQLKAGGKNE